MDDTHNQPPVCGLSVYCLSTTAADSRGPLLRGHTACRGLTWWSSSRAKTTSLSTSENQTTARPTAVGPLQVHQPCGTLSAPLPRPPMPCSPPVCPLTPDASLVCSDLPYPPPQLSGPAPKSRTQLTTRQAQAPTLSKTSSSARCAAGVSCNATAVACSLGTSRNVLEGLFINHHHHLGR